MPPALCDTMHNMTLRHSLEQAAGNAYPESRTSACIPELVEAAALYSEMTVFLAWRSAMSVVPVARLSSFLDSASRAAPALVGVLDTRAPIMPVCCRWTVDSAEMIN